MYGDQFGEFVCEYWDLKGLVSHSDFATNSNGESWDSSWEQSQVPVQKHWVSDSSKNNESLGLYVTSQLIWRQTPKLCTYSLLK